MRVHTVLALMLLAACDDRGAAPLPSPEPNASARPGSGETRTRIVRARGAVADLRSGAAVPVLLPPGFAIYPGAKVIRSTRVESGTAQHALVEFETPDPIASVLAFHRAQAQAAGATLVFNLAGPQAASIGGRMADGGDFALTARSSNAATAVQLAVNTPGPPSAP